MTYRTLTVTASDLDVLARTLWAEARGEGLAGQIAAGWTIRNRVELQTWYGKTITEVCKKPWQYSCWNKTDPNYPYLTGEKKIPAAEFRKAMTAANAVVTGDTDPTKGATHYYSTTMTKPPVWASPQFSTKTVQIGKHIFFTNVK